MATKKATRKVKRAKAKVDFSPTTAIEMYKAGKIVSEIAQAMGYTPGTGQNRVRYALEKAGIYKKGKPGRKPVGRATAAAPATETTTPAKTALPEFSLAIPATPELALATCLRAVDVSVGKLNMDGPARATFAKRLMGMIAANFGITEFQVRKPMVALDEARVTPYLIKSAAIA